MKIALGWRCTNLGALLAQPQKNTDKEYTYACFGGQAFQICLRDSAYATRIYIAFARAYAHLHGHKEFHRIHNVGHSKKTILTCWHVELSTLNLLLLWLNIYLSNSFNPSIHVFHSKIALGWRCTNLGALLAQPQKNTESREYTKACFGGQAFQGKPAISINLTLGVENKDEVGKRLWICLSLHCWQTAM